MSDPTSPNRAHLEKGGSINRPTPREEYGSVAERTVMGVRTIHDPNSVPAPDIPRGGICSSTPMRVDPHSNARHSNENRTVRPAEKARTGYTAEIKNRLTNFGAKNG